MIKFDDIFYYDGRCCTEFNISNVTINENEMKENFMSNRNIDERTTNERSEPYFNKVKYEPFQFKMTLWFDERQTENGLREIKKWLNQKTYKPLYFESEKDRIYQAMPVGESVITYDSALNGYIEITMRCKSYYCETPEFLTSVYDLSENTNEGTIIELNNLGDFNVKPDILIHKVGNGSLSITNINNNGKETKFNDFKKAKANLKFTGTVFDGEMVKIGDNTYEFDTGDGIINSHIQLWKKGNMYIKDTVVNKEGVIYKCKKSNSDENWNDNNWERQSESNIKVDISGDCKPSKAKLVFNQDPIEDGDSIIIGNNTYEFDLNDVYNAKNGNIPINISDFTTKATGKLRAKSNEAFADAKITIGEKTYHILPTTTESQILVDSQVDLTSWDKFHLDYNGLKSLPISKPVMLLNEKRDNSLDGIRLPYLNEEQNRHLSLTNRKIFELHSINELRNIPALGLADTGKFQPRTKNIKEQTVGDKLSVFKRDASSIEIDSAASSNDEFLIGKGFSNGLAQGGIANENLKAKEGDIILLAKRVDEGKINANKVKYKNEQYSSGDFELLRIKEIVETNNNSMVDYHENGTVKYILESPSKLFERNTITTLGVGKVVYGNSVDLANGKKHLSKYHYNFVNTERMKEEELKSTINSGDIVLGDTGAVGGIPMQISGTIRLGGKDRWETEEKIKRYAKGLENSYKGFPYFFNIILFKKQDEQITLLGNNTFTKPYQVKQGNTLDETCENLTKAINEDGIDWVHYSKGTFKNEDVEASYNKNAKTIDIESVENGSKGNKIVTVVNDWDDSRKLERLGFIINQFDYKTLTGGIDPSFNVVNKNGKTLIQHICECLNLNEEEFNIEYKDNEIHITAKTYGTIHNITAVLSNCYSCNFRTMSDKHTVTLQDGKDAEIDYIIPILYRTIDKNDNTVDADYNLDTKCVNIEHKKFGKKGNINISTTAINTFWDSGKKLIGGKDGLYDGEEVFIDGEYGDIISDKNVNIIDTFNNEELELVYGKNRLLIKGNCYIRFRMKYKLL